MEYFFLVKNKIKPIQKIKKKKNKKELKNKTFFFYFENAEFTKCANVPKDGMLFSIMWKPQASKDNSNIE